MNKRGVIMRKAAALLLVLSGLFLLYSCETMTGNGNPYYEKWEGMGMGDRKDWRSINVDVGYTKLKDIHPERAEEINAGFDTVPNGDRVEALKDGFLHVQMKTVPETGSTEGSGMKKPIARKLDRKGNVVWEKEYDYPTFSGSVGSLVIYPDGGFVLSVQAFPIYNKQAPVYENDAVIRCGEDGEVAWKREFEDYSGGLVKLVRTATNGDILVVGDGRMKDGAPTKEEVADSIAVTRLDSGGNIIGQKVFGGSDFDNVYHAVYSEKAGLVILGSTQSHDGDFGVQDNTARSDFVACVNDALQVRWVVHAGYDKGFDIDAGILADEEGAMYVLGHKREGESIPFKTLLTRISSDGNISWERQISEDRWGRTVGQLENGDIIIGVGRQNNGIVKVFDTEGNEKYSSGELNMEPGTIYPTLDGGYIIMSTRIKKTVPQPPIISSIWYDTELTLTKYGSDFKIQWRKTYDRYKNEIGADYAWPQRNGTILR